MENQETKILVITPKYHTSKSNPYLTNDLVNELANHSSKVVVIGYGEKTCNRKVGNIYEYIVNTSSNIKFFKYFLVWPLMSYFVLRVLIREKAFDQVIMFAPLSVMWPAALIIRFFKIKRRVVIIFDLFPIHQIQIGSLSKRLGFIAKKIECFLLSSFNEITAMGDNNKKSIERYYNTERRNAVVTILPLWASGTKVKIKVKPQTDIIKFVFGGQIIKGREIETMIEYLGQLRKRGVKLTLNVYSQGMEFEFLKDKYSEKAWLFFNAQVPRAEYFDILSEYQVGIIVTDRRVTLPTFPSKFLDYLSAGLASYCLVERESDLYGIAHNSNIIHLNHFDFSDKEFHRSMRFLSNLSVFDDELLQSEKNSLIEYFSIENAVNRLLR